MNKEMLHSLLIKPTLSSSLSPIHNPHSSLLSPPPLPLPLPLLLRFRPSHRQNLRYLKTLGIINPQTRTRTPSPESLAQILSTVHFFRSKGFSDSDFPRLAFLCPDLFSATTTFSHTQLQQIFDFFATDLAASAQESRRLILCCPKILLSNVEFCLRPTLIYLRQLGLQKRNLNAHLLNTRIDKLEEKIRFLRGVGFSEDESARVCARFPAVFGYSVEKNLRGKYEYLVREMKRNGVEEVNGFPQYFAFSLQKRIAPRHLHLKQRGVEVPLKTMLMWSDHRFYAKWN